MIGMKLLVIDSDANVCDMFKAHFEGEGCEVLTAGDGAQGLRLFREAAPDMVLLEMILPGMDGQQVLSEIRKNSSVPVIMVASKGEVLDKVLALEFGADDYMVKPVNLKELGARVKAVLRRYRPQERGEVGDVIRFDNFEISQEKFELKLCGKKVDIPPKELQLLYCLASNPNRVFSREQLLEHVWDFAFLGDSRTVDVHIKRLREKLNGISTQWSLKTVWGIGYKFELAN